MIKMFSKDMIQTHIVQHLSQGQRGPECRVETWEIVTGSPGDAILYKLKSGVQWHLLPVNTLIFSDKLSWEAIYYHYRKWCKDGSWRKVWLKLLSGFKFLLDLYISQLDGSHRPAKRGGEAVAYQGRKKYKTTNILLLTDRNGLVVACGKPLEGNHNDLYKIEEQLKEMLAQLTEMDIPIDGLFINADSGFDSKILREALEKQGVMLNSPPGRRNKLEENSDIFLDEEMYEERFVIERTNAWNDSFRSILLRQDTTLSSWWVWHFLAFTYWMLKPRIQKL